MFGQVKNVYIQGRVVDSLTSRAVDKVVVSTKSYGTTITVSDASGLFHLKTSLLEFTEIQFDRTGYKSLIVKIDTLRIKDTLTLNTFLVRTSTLLPEVEITSSPNIVAAYKDLDILDYTFLQKKLLVLISKKRDQYTLLLLGENQAIIRKYELPNLAIPPAFYTDYNNKVNIITEEQVFRVTELADTLTFIVLDKQYFFEKIFPCKLKKDSICFYSDQIWDVPYFNYLLYNTNARTTRFLHKVIDKVITSQYNKQYLELNNSCVTPTAGDIYPFCKKGAKDISEQTGIPLFVVAARLTGFPHNFFYKTPYAPIFNINDTIHIFDHYSAYLYTINKVGNLIDSSKIFYHQMKNWRKELIQDIFRSTVYMSFEKNGWTYLKRIHSKTGLLLNDEFKPQYRYIENIKIKEGTIYYIYRPFESSQAKYLYREHIGF